MKGLVWTRNPAGMEPEILLKDLAGPRARRIRAEARHASIVASGERTARLLRTPPLACTILFFMTVGNRLRELTALVILHRMDRCHGRRLRQCLNLIQCPDGGSGRLLSGEIC